MGFIETLVPAAPALIEKNETQRMCYKCISVVIGMPVFRAHPNICRRASKFEVFAFIKEGMKKECR